MKIRINRGCKEIEGQGIVKKTSKKGKKGGMKEDMNKGRNKEVEGQDMAKMT